MARWCSGYHYYTTSFKKPWTQVLRRFKSCSWRFNDLRWWGSLTMVPIQNKVKRPPLVKHTKKTVHHLFLQLNNFLFHLQLFSLHSWLMFSLDMIIIVWYPYILLIKPMVSNISIDSFSLNIFFKFVTTLTVKNGKT